MLYRIASFVALVATALAAPTEERICPQTICFDGINACGVRYGDCYDVCEKNRPTAPPCDPAVLSPSSSSTTLTENCSTRTVCADYINDCGVWYDCSPWPTFTAPPCTTSSSYVITTIAPPIATITEDPTTDCHSQTICTDMINECGQTYGGCFSACTPWPTFTPPPCTTTTTTAPITTITPAASTATTICVDYLKTCTEGSTTAVLTYGGCYAAGGPTPTFSTPSCPTATVTP
ncbi:hypothetical protein SCAR479_04996 [Seiridium cardinale]|uniref:Antifreeze protein n=1 Tax=Seiridium cardinale TaxID=138064 RepID=A0ABR2Y4X1_9PEZI